MHAVPVQVCAPADRWLADAAAGRLGWTVRCTPRARTVRAVLPASAVRYAKCRRRAGAVRREAFRLRLLAALGFRVPEVCGTLSGHGGHWLSIQEVPGRALQVLWRDALATPRGHAGLRRHATEVLAPWVARFHRTGLVHRDLYGNHLFARDLAEAPAVIDVERVFRPRWRRERWWVKDLAALWSSRPEGVPDRLGLAFLRAYLRARGFGDALSRRRARRWLPRIAGKAAHIRARRPRFG